MKKKIANYNYEVDTLGNIYRIETGRKIKPTLNRDGYAIVFLWKDNKSIVKTVHRLVALAHLPNPENKPCVNHKDGVKHHNFLENLEWMTYSENTQHSFDNGLQIPLQGEFCSTSIFTEAQIKEVCELIQDGKRNLEIHQITGVSRAVVKQVRARKTWTYLSKDYIFPKKDRVISDETAHWVCRKISEGLRICDIVALAQNPKINKTSVRLIKTRQLYADISAQYDF